MKIFYHIPQMYTKRERERERERKRGKKNKMEREFKETLSHAYLKWLLPCVDQLVPLEFGALNESFATLCTHVHPWTMSVEVLPHCSIVTK